MKAKSHTLLKSFFIIIIWIFSLLLGKIAGVLIIGQAAAINLNAFYSANAILYLFVVFVLLILLKILKLDSVMRNLKVINLNLDLYAFLALLICFAGDIFLFVKYINIIASNGYLDNHNILFAGPTSLFLAILFYTAVGFSEELCFRGIILKFWLSHFSNDKNHRLKAAVITSILFGTIHLINLSNGFHFSNLIYTFTQIIFAGMYGMFFSAILFKTKSILLCGIVHGMINFIGNISDMFIPMKLKDSIPDTILTSYAILESITTVLVLIPAFIWAINFLLIKDNKLMEIDNETYS